MKYIDADKLKAAIEKKYRTEIAPWCSGVSSKSAIYDCVLPLIDALQQDKEAIELEMCEEHWWEEQGWIMIPPNVTLKGIESLLKQVKKKLQQEQPSLPSNLDEAAEAFAHNYDMGTCDGYAQECFKAGAEWMAEQGETLMTFVENVSCRQGDFSMVKVVLGSLLKDGDKVIIQIRKK